MNSTKTLKITYRDETLASRGRDALEQAVDDEAFEPVIQVNITEPHDLERLMSAENLELLTGIVEDRPESITELAKCIDREYKSVHRNLTELEAFGVIEFAESGVRKQPILRGGADELELEVTVERSDGVSDVHPSASV